LGLAALYFLEHKQLFSAQASILNWFVTLAFLHLHHFHVSNACTAASAMDWCCSFPDLRSGRRGKGRCWLSHRQRLGHSGPVSHHPMPGCSARQALAPTGPENVGDKCFRDPLDRVCSHQGTGQPQESFQQETLLTSHQPGKGEM
jgi:hypothetical protein